MPLTDAQLPALKADISSDATLNAFPNTIDGAFEIAKAYNLTATPDFWVWRSSVTKSEYVQGVGPEGTTFTWVGNGFITRAAGEQMAWAEIFNHVQACNPSLPNVRQAFTDIFSGTGNAATNRTHMTAVSRRKATRGEKLYASGTGSTASPATMGFEGQITFQDVYKARNLP